MADETRQFTILPVITDANYGYLGSFDNVDQSPDSSFVASSDTIHLVHNDDGLLRVLSTKGLDIRISFVILLFFEPSFGKIIDAAISREGTNGSADGCLIAHIRGVLFEDFKA